MGTRRKRLLTLAAAALFTTAGAFHAAAQGPEGEIRLDSLADLFGPVVFDHAMHVELAGSCGACHHHTTGEAPENPVCARCHQAGEEASAVACKDCHASKRFSAAYLAEVASDPHRYHTGRPGLKGAYHQKCLGCHQESGAPSGCVDCHQRTEAGDRFYRSGRFAPKPTAQTGH